MSTLAALASIPSRASFLPRVLASLRPQVDRLCVYLNGYEAVPQCVLDLVDEYVISSENEGAERKLWWANQHDGYYLSCDDDIVYAASYVASMVSAIEARSGRFVVTAHGRLYIGRPRTVHDVEPGSVGMFYKRVDEGRVVNHGGTGCMAWDTRCVRVPAAWPLQNIADMQVAIWAQQQCVPMWLIAHQAHWLEPLALVDPQGLFKRSQIEGHDRRNRLLAAHGRAHGWKLYGDS